MSCLAELTCPRMLYHLDALGFSKECQVAFPHKQSWFVKLRRDSWEGPAL